MDDDLIDDDRLSTARKSRLPGTGFFYPDSLDEDHAERRTREAVDGAEAVVVADGDADGLACVALVRAAHGGAGAATPADAPPDVEPGEDDGLGHGDDETDRREQRDGGDNSAGGDSDPAAPWTDAADDGAGSPVAFVGASPYSLGDALARVADHAPPDVPVYVCDLCPDRYDDVGGALEALVDRAGRVRWFDHHQWDDAVAAAVREAGVDLVVGASDEECSADVTLRSLDFEFPAHLESLAAVTRDHDLWEKEDPRSDDLADFARWADDEAYLAVVGEHGPDLPAEARAFLEDRRTEKGRLIDLAVERARTHEVGPWTVAVTYGRCSQNEVAEALRERGADAAAVVKPAGSASLRGTDSFERCHEVAELLGGGGHPQAAGCKPDIYDDMLDYADHWTTAGGAARRVILAAFERIAERHADATAEGGAGEHRDGQGDDAGGDEAA